MCLPLRDRTHTPGAGVVFDRAPCWHLTHMPPAVKGTFMSVIGTKGRPGIIAAWRCLIPSAALGVLIPAGPILLCHISIVTYSPVTVGDQQRCEHLLDWVPICDLSLPNVLSPTLAA